PFTHLPLSFSSSARPLPPLHSFPPRRSSDLATVPRGHTLSTPTRPAWGPRPTRQVTSVPVTTYEKLHRHSRQYRAFSTADPVPRDRKSTRLNSSHVSISYAVFCLQKQKQT